MDLHPIEHLMNTADKAFDKMVKNEIHTLEQAAAQYRKLRGRYPPPGFSAWYTYAVENNAIVNERFWDQIYHDLAPFWSTDPVLLRKQAHVFSPKISIRNGKVEAKAYNQHSKLGNWEDMLTTLANEPNVHLPDIDIALNVNKEPAMLVPWEMVDTALSMSRKLMLEPTDIIPTFSGLGNIENLTEGFDWQPEWLGPRLTHPASSLGPRPLWSLVKPACPPKSATREARVYDDIWDPEGGTKEMHSAAALLPLELPVGTVKGYRDRNWTRAIDACEHPHLQGLHSAFVSPKEMGVATKIFPLFSDTKFSMSNDILLPDAAEWNASSVISEPSTVSWEDKDKKLFWRGATTEAHLTARYWQRFQRERLVSMLNATHVEIAEGLLHAGNESAVGVGYAKNFRLLPANDYILTNQKKGKLAEWVNGWADVGFTNLECASDPDGCEALGEYFSTTELPTSNQETKAKYAIVLDDSDVQFSDHLRNSEVTLRASIYRKWFDSRIVPWHHFIPMDNTFVDLYGVMEYFVGTRSSSYAHDDEARRVAEAGKEWADKVLRKEDMLIYVYRLLLEYARVVDDKRERLGWHGDLVD
ncbi:hypothetical protein GQ44DRAFT_607047 [Phaeosphaeriaceae sp. PMI808]|nr:hypothetical protein GQ44DRAFT_607047 [Phaeosphaeriaceae sp. PMI808]